MIGTCRLLNFESDVYFALQSGQTRYGFRMELDNRLLLRISLPQAGQFICGGIVTPVGTLRHLGLAHARMASYVR